MRIQHNIMAMNAYRNYNTNTSALSKNLEKLSSGYKINRAGDDAAGLAISEKMRAQITGLEGAQKNAKDGISLVQTAEGALTEVHDMLNRMYSLAEQSANGTYDNETDRAQLQKEVDQLRTEINRISESANFNGIKLLDGSMEGTGAPGGAISTAPVESVDGEVATEATKARITIKLDGTTFTFGGSAISTTTNLGDKTISVSGNNIKLSDLFNITGTFATGGTITLEAKNAGALHSDVIDAFNGTTNAVQGATIDEVKNGTNRGDGAAATKAKYELTFDITKFSGGETFEIDGKKFKISMDGQAATESGVYVIDLSGFGLGTTSATEQVSAANKIVDTLSGQFTDFKFTSLTSANVSNGKFTISFTANSAGAAHDLGEVRVAVDSADAIQAKHTVIGKDNEPGDKGSFAKVVYDIDLSKLAEGDTLTFGNTTLTIAKEGETPKKGEISLADAKDSAKLTAALQQNGYGSGKIEISADGKQLTIYGTQEGQKAADLLKGDGKVTHAQANPQGASGGLTLQIGENSETYNQLQVQIKSTDAEAIGIAGVDIGTQTGAAAALADIEDAINYISDVRGTLGATQNRLDHTINNLSVMQENIQDAESTIRDTDVAEEMMAYTKNNILIQSAQAMLAQANQVPQGVLQLLG